MLALITYNQVFHLPENNSTLPLCVDLDGSLIKTDMGFESVVKLIKTNPLYLFNLFFWLFLGSLVFPILIAFINVLLGIYIPHNIAPIVLFFVGIYFAMKSLKK